MSAEDQVPVHNNAEKHRFELQIGDLIAIAEYQVKDKTITFTHTEVPPALEGRGVGAHLVAAALDDSRTQGYRVVPACPFVAQYVRRHSEYSDLID